MKKEETKPVEETKVENYELDQKALDSIASAVVKGLDIDNKIAASVSAAVEQVEKTIQKNTKTSNEPTIKVNAYSDRKEVRFVRALEALKGGNNALVAKYNESNIADREKAGYANETTGADGAYLVPPADFEAEVEKIVPNYGVAFRDADVRTVRSNSVITNKRGSNVTMYETAEAGQKTGTKMTIEQYTMTLRKFAAIAPLTDELNDDSAIDFYNELIQGFAEERARIADVMVFTENGTTAAKKGLLRTAGVNVEPVVSATAITWDDLMNAEAKVPTNAMANGKHYMHRSLWNSIKQVKDGSGRYQWLPASGFVTPWGTPVVLADVLPNIFDADSDGSTPLGVFTDLKRVKLYVKKGLVIDILREGTVHDADGNAVNLGEKDMTAVRAVSRMGKIIKFPEAATVYGTGNVS